MPKIFWALSTLLCLNLAWSQADQQLTPELKAYLFHTVRKSPILERHIGKAFEYSGPIIKLEDGQINYDSIDRILILDPNLLIIRSEVLSYSLKGILTEACNKTALFEMCQQIAHYQEGASLQSLPLLNRYFEVIFQQVPAEFKRGKTYEALMNHEESPLLMTNVSFNERLLNLQLRASLKMTDCKKILDAQEKAINEVIAERTKNLFGYLGGKSNSFNSILFAAGDGSYTEGLLRERDKDEFGAWNKGLPKAIGLFPYETVLEGEKKPSLRTKRITEKEVLTYGHEQNTEIHFDVWGYNSNNQTTVIVEKGSRQYPLFGSETTRFLTPDSTFSKGNTFMKIMNDLYQKTYNELKNQLEGKEGLKNQVIAARTSLGEIENAINQKEGDLGELYKVDYKTKNKMSRRDQKRKQVDPKFADQLRPTTKARKKAKNKRQWDLVELYAAYDETLKTLDELTRDRDEVQAEFNRHSTLYFRYQGMIGTQWVPFQQQNGLYLFEDGTTFDLLTQNLTFPATQESEVVQIRLLSIPEDFEGSNSDEIMMHVSMCDARPFYDADFEMQFNDVFLPDAFQYESPIFKPSDSLFLKQLFAEYKKNPVPIELSIEGLGIGIWKDSNIVRDPEQKELTGYPGTNAEEKSASRNAQEFKSLRQSSLQIKINRSLSLRISSSTDPVASNLNTTQFNLDNFLKSNGLTKNEALSLLRSRGIMLRIKTELTAYSPKYLPPNMARTFIDALDNSVNKVTYKVGQKVIKMPKIKP